MLRVNRDKARVRDKEEGKSHKVSKASNRVREEGSNRAKANKASSSSSSNRVKANKASSSSNRVRDKASNKANKASSRVREEDSSSSNNSNSNQSLKPIQICLMWKGTTQTMTRTTTIFLTIGKDAP